MEKIKQNPKRVFAIVAGVLFIAALLFMLLPGIVIKMPSGDITQLTTVSLFGLAFGGVIKNTPEQPGGQTFNCAINAQALIAFIFIIIAIVGVIVLVYGLISDKFNKKANIALSIIIGVLVIVAAILLFASKESSFKALFKNQFGDDLTPEQIDLSVAAMKELIVEFGGSYGLGAGAIVSPIMMLLGAGSLGGVICLSAKE